MSTVPTSTVTSLWLPALTVVDWGVNGVVLGSDATSTTYSLECGSQSAAPSTSSSIVNNSTSKSTLGLFYTIRPTPQCSLPTSLHVTAGPSGVAYVATGKYFNPRETFTVTGPVATIISCSWDASRTGRPMTATAATATSTGIVADCDLKLNGSGLVLDSDIMNAPVRFSPVTITGAVDARATAPAGNASSNASTSTSSAGAPGSGYNGLAGTGGLLAVAAVLLGLL